MTDIILEAKNIVKQFGGLVAVNNVDLQLRPGEVLCLLGDNGAGKSTLIKCISGVYKADSGEIYWQGEKVRVMLDMVELYDRESRTGATVIGARF